MVDLVLTGKIIPDLIAISTASIAVGFLGLLFVSFIIAKASSEDISDPRIMAIKTTVWKSLLIVELVCLSFIAWAHPKLAKRHWLLIHYWHFGGKPMNVYEWLKVITVLSVVYFILVFSGTI